MALQLIDLGQEVEYIDIDTAKVPYTFSVKLTDKTYMFTIISIHAPRKGERPALWRCLLHSLRKVSMALMSASGPLRSSCSSKYAMP